MIPGLENAEFLRYGIMHRNTYLNSPGLLDANYAMIGRPNIYFAGQMTGVEGFIASAGRGFIAGVSASRAFLGQDKFVFPETTMLGAMAGYVSRGGMGKFVPMNANFGIIEPLGRRVKGGKIAKYEAIAERSFEQIDNIKNNIF